jgi:hypothetical protein
MRWFQANSAAVTNVLDIGGGTGDKGDELKQLYPSMAYDCVDLIQNGRCQRFDGERLSNFANKSYDVVMSVYAYHHAGDKTPALLAEAKRVARKWVLTLDDLKADDAAGDYAQRLHPGCQKSDATGSGGDSTINGCIFRTDAEYKSIFPAVGLSLLNANYDVNETRTCLSNYVIPRGFYATQPIDL